MPNPLTLPARPYMSRIINADAQMDAGYVAAADLKARVAHDCNIDVLEAGYCLDAPELLPTGGAVESHDASYLIPRWSQRRWNGA